MVHIIVIGVGALGKRHLGSILESKMKKKVYCVDINEHALEGMEMTEDVSLYRSISEVPCTEFDFALFAMSSKGRREMYDELVRHATVKNIVFEKVLFQTVEDYYWVGKDMEARGISAWVNCARRQMESYQMLRQKLQGDKFLEFHVTGGNWGMACNSIHMLDLIAFLSQDSKMKVDKLKLEPKIIESKRQGYKEVNGVIFGSGERVRMFSISSVEEVNFPIQIEIITETARILVLESKGVLIEKKHDGEEMVQEFKMPYQSQMTQYVMEDILERQESRLTTFEESMRLHLMLIEPMIEYFEEHGMEEGKCPIT